MKEGVRIAIALILSFMTGVKIEHMNCSHFFTFIQLILSTTREGDSAETGP